MYNGLRARVVPYLPDVWIGNLETMNGSGTGYTLIAVPGSAIAPHAVRMTSRPQYSFARRVGRTTAWLEESEIAALYRDRFRLAEEHRDKVKRVLETGSDWTPRVRPAAEGRIWLELALVPSVPADRFVDSAHIANLSGFFKEQSKPGAAPHPVLCRLRPGDRQRRPDLESVVDIYATTWLLCDSISDVDIIAKSGHTTQSRS